MLFQFVTMTSNAKVGSFFHCNAYSYGVAHDCVMAIM